MGPGAPPLGNWPAWPQPIQTSDMTYAPLLLAAVGTWDTDSLQRCCEVNYLLWGSSMATAVTSLLLFLHLCLSGSWGQCPDDLSVATLQGRVQGTRLSVLGHDTRAFLGVPYAKPPLGELRFRPPQPADGWEGVKNAAQFPNTCCQVRDTAYPADLEACVESSGTLSCGCMFLIALATVVMMVLLTFTWRIA
ncbi:hypothetical protein NHX12_008120 [Muraenolepis orangiensis]|uniref:Carboxylesterase type B domain-containing protein n=1 Tax=Muraenolepis orangiensis TaxID=630683 RepID=A0A9Q0DKV2_9TELE|nr:hypothetical protein NHX12_008120 [Muraenolepis orangiensis]